MMEIPDEYICPITLEIMVDPVICEDGYTYEKKSILQLRTSISPMTRQLIDTTKLIPNRALKHAIIRFNKINNIEFNYDDKKSIEKELEITKKNWLLIMGKNQILNKESEKLEEEKNVIIKKLNDLINKLKDDDENSINKELVITKIEFEITKKELEITKKNWLKTIEQIQNNNLERENLDKERDVTIKKLKEILYKLENN